MSIEASCKSHCCTYHGCKYGHSDCAVVTGKVKQSGPCEECGLELEGYYGVEEQMAAKARWSCGDLEVESVKKERSRMILRNVQPEDLVENESYLVCKTEDGKRECFLAVWTGKCWTTDRDGDYDSNWPDAVFENPFRAKVTGSMSMEEYQAWVEDNLFYDGKELSYPAIGLCEEAGEFAGKVKKMLRDKDGVYSEEMRQAMIKELGDVLFYLAMAANRLGSSLDEAAQSNIAKGEGRKARGTLKGSGDDR